MVKVKIVNKDETGSTYNVTYPKAYVQKVIIEENLRGENRKVKEIYVNGNIVAKMISNHLVYVDWPESNNKPKSKVKNPSKNEGLVTIEIPGTSYWVSTSTAGNTLISYQAEPIPAHIPEDNDDLPF